MNQFISPSFLVLSALVDGDKHGYAIMQWVAAKTEDSIHLGPASLYTTIRKLEHSGLICEVPDSDPKRRTYHCTDLGQSTLEQEMKTALLLFKAS